MNDLEQKLKKVDSGVDSFFWGKGAGARWCWIITVCGAIGLLTEPLDPNMPTEEVLVLWAMLVGLPFSIGVMLSRKNERV